MTNSFEKTSWQWQLEQLKQQLTEWIEVKLRSIDLPSNNWLAPWVGELLIKLAWLILLAIICWFGYRVIYPYWQKRINKNLRTQTGFEQSPIQLYSVTELLTRSQELQNAGDYTQASRWLYLALLQRLSDADLIPHQPSRTDREYLKLLQTFPSIESGEVLISTHEQLQFSNMIVTSADFDRCQQAYGRIEAAIVGGNSAALTNRAEVRD